MYISIKEATEIQKELANKVITEDMPGNINYVAGIDVSQQAFKKERVTKNPDKNSSFSSRFLYTPASQDVPFYAAVVVHSFPDLKIVEKADHSEHVDFPYIPGFLAFREVPVIVKALEKIKTKPDVILVDGHGISHPRGLGIASHMGILTGYRTVGCAKSILAGKPETDLPPEKGSFVSLVWKGKIVGNVVRTKDKVNPVYVSTGHKITLKKATEIVIACTTKYRIPEPLRSAHDHANYVRKNNFV